MNKTPSPKTSHRKIYDYWKNKAISEDGNEYIDYGCEGCDTNLLNKVKSVAVVYDRGEPKCWGCGMDILIQSDDYEKRLQENVDSIWSYPEIHSLQRCHIVPRQLGGEDTPSNLFLLCHNCHRESPDTSSRKQFLRWVYERRQKPNSLFLYVEEAKEILKRVYGINNPFFLDLFDKNDMKKHLGEHAGAIRHDSIVAYVVDNALRTQKSIDAFRIQAEAMVNNVLEQLNNTEK